MAKLITIEQGTGMIGAVNTLHVARCLQVCDDVAEEKNIKLSIGFDFHEYVSIARATPTKGPTFPNFQPDRSPIKPGEGYWIIGVDKNKDVVGLEAARLYDLSHSNFAEHLQSLKAFYAAPTIHAHPGDRCTCIAPAAKKMTGKVAYHGDLWVRRDFRGQGVGKILTGITHAVSFAMWAPDFLCALVERWTLDKNVDDMLHHEPGGAILQLVEDNIVEDNWLSWLTGEELRGRFDCYNGAHLSLAPSFSPT